MRAGSRRKTGAPAKISLCLKHAATFHVIAQDSGANHRGAVFVGNRDCDLWRRLRRARALRPRQLAENQAEENGARHRALIEKINPPWETWQQNRMPKYVSLTRGGSKNASQPSESIGIFGVLRLGHSSTPSRAKAARDGEPRALAQDDNLLYLSMQVEPIHSSEFISRASCATYFRTQGAFGRNPYQEQ